MTAIATDRLLAWMDERDLGAGAIEDVEELGGGSQNILVRFTRGGERFVLRRPPLHKRAKSDETMRREARVLAALAHTDVPHPRLIAACDGTDVLGSAFYLMEEVDGVNPAVGLPEGYRAETRWRRELGFEMADAAASVGAVDHVGLGLEDLGRPEGFLERQVPRWLSQLESYTTLPGYPGPTLPMVDEVARWLEDRRPRDARPGLLHGDFHFANVLCRIDRPGVAAIVDWELTTIGDPLLDLGWLLATWPDGDAPIPALRLEPWDGFPTRAELVARYAARSDRDLAAMPWYEVLACFKLGIVLEGTHARACAGRADREVGDQLHESAVALLERAGRRIASG